MLFWEEIRRWAFVNTAKGLSGEEKGLTTAFPQLQRGLEITRFLYLDYGNIMLH